MNQQRVSFAEVKAVLVDRIDMLARELFPDGYYGSGRKYWMAKNPRRDDRTPGSFWIYLQGPKAGGWCDAASGDKGDVINLVMLSRGGDAEDARKWGAWWAGIDPSAPPAVRQAMAAEADQRKREREAEAAAKLARDRKSAHGIWLHGIPLATKAGGANPAALLAFRYFQKRGIDLGQLPRLPGATRLLRDQKHVESGRTFAALGTIMIGADGKPVALHRVFITDTAEKIEEEPQRKIWPSFIGGFLPLWDGGTNVSAQKQSERGELVPVIACEGIEDGYAAAIGKPDHRVRGAGTLGNLKHMPLFPGDDRLIVWRDNDWGKPQAQQQLDQAVAALVARGETTGTGIYLTASYVGKDANDLMRGE